ncbi:N-acylneuraminate-9-phosphatase [Flavobacteriaceae bacterium UJ101]|nr:N-acylneuraminate-9-phosphatase [Flavobacteriaceae bacterium UJ101]
MNLNSIQHIFFDLDNTLWDFIKNSKITLENLYKEHHVEEEHHIAFSTWYDHYYDINEQLWAEYRDHKITKQELKDSRFRKAFQAVGVKDTSLPEAFEAVYLNHLPKNNFLRDGAHDLLEYLKKQNKYTLHIITNGFKDVSLKKIKGSGIDSYFDVVVSAEDVNTRKPDPKVFQHALDLAQASKEESIIIGDDYIADIVGGLDFGIQAIFYNILDMEVKNNNFIEIKHLNEVKKYL